jgi:hypothetical protein
MAIKPALANTATFVVDNLIGDTTGQTWVGKFTAKKRLNFNDQLRLDNFRRQMLGPAEGEPTVRAASMAHIFSNLLVRLTEAPSWWVDADEGRELEDENLILDVYEKALKVESDARAETSKKAETAKADLTETLAAVDKK